MLTATNDKARHACSVTLPKQIKSILKAAAITTLFTLTLSGCDMKFNQQYFLEGDGESLMFGKLATAELRWLFIEVYDQDVGPYADMLRENDLWETDYYGEIALHLLADLLEISPLRANVLLQAECVTVSAKNAGWLGGTNSIANPDCVLGATVGRPNQ